MTMSSSEPKMKKRKLSSSSSSPSKSASGSGNTVSGNSSGFVPKVDIALLRKRAVEEKLKVIGVQLQARESELRELLFLQSRGNITEYEPMAPAVSEAVGSYNTFHEGMLTPFQDDVNAVATRAGVDVNDLDSASPALYSASPIHFLSSKGDGSVEKGGSKGQSSSAMSGVVLTSKPSVHTRNKKPKFAASVVLNKRASSSRKSMSVKDIIETSVVHGTITNMRKEGRGGLCSENISEVTQRDAGYLLRIGQLQEEGLWTAKQVGRHIEPAMNKCHWDFLLEEMAWMANDFKLERKWKMDNAKKTSKMVLKYFKEQESRDERIAKQEELALRRKASMIAREVKKFWSQIGKVKEHVENLKVEEVKKKEMEEKLSQMVNQTEALTKELTKELKDTSALSASLSSSVPTVVDDDFQMEDEEMVDLEDTMDADEKMETEKMSGDESNTLNKEANAPLEDLMMRYKGYLEHNDEDEEEAEDGETSAGIVSDAMSSAESERKTEGDSNMRLDTDVDAEEDEYSEEGEEGEGMSTLGDLMEGDLSDSEERVDDGVDSQAIMTKYSEEASAAQPTGFTLATSTVKTAIPSLLKHTLREYQHIGLDWLVAMHEKNLNGILADEMGLGKTIMTISMLAYLACEKHDWGPHLIVVPTSVMLNWEMELKKWCPGFKILTYYGNQKERKLKRTGWSKKNSFHVVITSYKLVVQDQVMFRRKKWKYLILDEAQHIKNFQSQRWQVLLRFNAEHRILLTGTPLQNNLMELWSLMHFLMPHVFRSHSEFKEWFCRPVNDMIEGEKFDMDLVNRLHGILRPFLLRRLKKDVEKQLPPKFEHIVPCPLSKRQRLLYDEFMSSGSTVNTLSSGNYLGVMNILMQLRKVCNHPDLFEERPIVSAFDQLRPLRFVLPGFVEGIVPLSSGCDTASPTSATLLTGRDCVDLSFLNLKFVNHIYDSSVEQHRFMKAHCATSAQILSPSSFNMNGLFPSSALGSTAGRVMSSPSSLLAWKQKVIHMDMAERREQKSTLAYVNHFRGQPRECLGGWDLRKLVSVHLSARDVHVSSSSALTNYNTYWRDTTILKSLVKLPAKRAEEFQSVFDQYVFVIPRVRAPPPALLFTHERSNVGTYRRFMEHKVASFLGKGASMEVPGKPPPRTEVDIYRRPFIRQTLYFPDRRLIQFDCGKLQRLAILLHELKAKGSRALIFTQMSKVLDVMEKFLNLHGFTYFRLDGTTKVEQRQMLMERFNKDPRIFLFILSTRSGGVGINLTGADTVIFYDSDWNPAMDAQAQDRCHRIGQTREVHIYRLISERTVEENILKKAQQKRMLDNVVISDGQFNTEFFSQVDLRELLGADGGSSSSGSKAMEDKRINQKEFEQAIRQVEDLEDVTALDRAQREYVADMSEFDEDRVAANGEENGIEGRSTRKEKGKEKETSTVHGIVDEDGEALLPAQNGHPDEDRMGVLDPAKSQSSVAATGAASSLWDELEPIQRYALSVLYYRENTDGVMDEIDGAAVVVNDADGHRKREEDYERVRHIKTEEDKMIDEAEEALFYEVSTPAELRVYHSQIYWQGLHVFGPPQPDNNMFMVKPKIDSSGVCDGVLGLEPLKYSKYSAYLDVIEELALRLSLQQKRRLKRKLRYPSTPSATTTPSNGSATDSALMEPTRLESSPAEDVLVKSPAKKKRKKNEPLTKKAKEKELMKQKKAKDKALKRAEKARLKAGGELSTGEDDDKTDQGLSSSGGSHLSAALSSSTSKKAKSSRSKKGGEKKKNDKKKKKDGSSSASKSPARESKTAKRKRSKKDGKEATSTTVQALPPFEHPWTVSEDRIILSCVKAFGENWLLISDLVNSSFYSFWSRRTSKQCYHRFKYHLRDGGEPGEVAAHAASPAAVAARKKAAAESLALAQGTLTTAEITIIEVMKKRAKDLARQHALQQSLAHAAFTSTSLPKPVVSEEPPGFKSPLRTLTDLKYKRLLHAQNSGDGHKGRSGSNNNVRRDGSAASSSEAAGDSNDTTSGQTGSRSTPMQTSSSTVGRGNSGVSLYAPGTASTAPSGDSDRGSARIVLGNTSSGRALEQINKVVASPAKPANSNSKST